MSVRRGNCRRVIHMALMGRTRGRSLAGDAWALVRASLVEVGQWGDKVA